MTLESQQCEVLKQKLMAAIDEYRPAIMEPVEQALIGSSTWNYLRGRLLNALGDRGLAGRIREILNAELNN